MHGLLLRVSGEQEGATVDGLRSDVPHAAELTAFAEAAVLGDDPQPAREALTAAAGEPAMLDAAALIAGFSRTNRIADVTGLELEAPMNAMSAAVQDELGLRRFRSSEATSSPGALSKLLGRAVGPFAMRRLGKLIKRKP